MANKNSFLPKVINKTTEIAILWELFNANTYFTDSFSFDELQQMETNIKCDFPLTMNTNLSKRINELQEQTEMMAKELDERNATNRSLAVQIADVETETKEQKRAIDKLATFILKDDPNADEVYEALDHAEVIRLKIAEDILLVPYDKDYLKEILPEKKLNL